MQEKSKKIFTRIIIVAVWLLIWQIASMVTGLELILASPVSVFWALLDLLELGRFYATIGYSFCKIMLGFIIAFVGGSILGVVASRISLVDEFLKPPVQLMKTLPMTSFIILLLIWFGSKNVAVFISFIVTFPMIYTSVVTGVKQVDKQLLEMADVFGVSLWRRIKGIYIPKLLPFVEAGVKTAMGMCWKAGVSAEVIGLVRYSVGEQLYYSKLYLLTAELFAWSIVVVVISMLFELLFIKILRLAVKFIRKV